MAKFHGNILNPSENIAKSFRGATFLTHTVYINPGLSENPGFAINSSGRKLMQAERPEQEILCLDFSPPAHRSFFFLLSPLLHFPFNYWCGIRGSVAVVRAMSKWRLHCNALLYVLTRFQGKGAEERKVREGKTGKLRMRERKETREKSWLPPNTLDNLDESIYKLPTML